jgi:pyrroloquinoline quinone (PQQ) biosynthesis protein C
VDRSQFREALLGVMERKQHWAWPAFSTGQVAKDRLHVHLEQEYGTYVRDFPVLVGRVYTRCPVAVVRRDLIENIFEEETGGLHAGRPHPELFLEYPRGLGMDLARFERVELLPASAAYRDLLDRVTLSGPWEIGAAVMTLFVEGTAFERGELEPSAPRRPVPPLEDHPLVRYYGLPIERLALTRAHRSVEGEHRASAWRVVLDHTPPERHVAVVDAMNDALAAWLSYRDGVAAACGVTR